MNKIIKNSLFQVAILLLLFAFYSCQDTTSTPQKKSESNIAAGFFLDKKKSNPVSDEFIWFNLTLKEKFSDEVGPHSVLISVLNNSLDCQVIMTTIFKGKDFDGTFRSGFDSQCFRISDGNLSMTYSNSSMSLNFVSFSQRSSATNFLHMIFDPSRGCDLPISKVTNFTGYYFFVLPGIAAADEALRVTYLKDE